MKIAIIFALCLIAYSIWFNLHRLCAIRQAERDRQGKLDADWQTFSRALDQLNQRKDEFFASLGHLTETERKELWQPVCDKSAAACRFFLNHDFARSMAQITLASNEAELIIGQNQAA